jgi:hypothetical protein
LSDYQQYLAAPLSSEQIDAAVAFGAETQTDPYMMWFPQNEVQLTVGTVFGRIATISRLAREKGLPVPRDLVDGLNTLPELRGHYSIQTLSHHRNLSVRRCMENLDKHPPYFGYTDILRQQSIVEQPAPKSFAHTMWFKNGFVSPFDFFELAVVGFLKYKIEHQRIPFPLK